MSTTPALQTLGQSLDHWQALYIVSITLALLSTVAIVFFAFHKDHKTGLRASNYVYIIASLLSVLSTIVIVNKTKALDAEKDRQAGLAHDAAQLQSNQAKATAETAKADAAKANQKAQEANDHAAKLEAENIRLGGQIGNDAAKARAAESALDAKNKETSDFAHSLQQQQATMQEQAKASPVLTDFQIRQLATSLAPYTGQEVIIHRTVDTVVGRLASTIAMSLQMAGIKFPQYFNDIGQLYQGVSVAVHDPTKVPPLAEALVVGLRQAGIVVHPVAAPQQVPEGKVAIYLGPN